MLNLLEYLRFAVYSLQSCGRRRLVKTTPIHGRLSVHHSLQEYKALSRSVGSSSCIRGLRYCIDPPYSLLVDFGKENTPAIYLLPSWRGKNKANRWHERYTDCGTLQRDGRTFDRIQSDITLKAAHTSSSLSETSPPLRWLWLTPTQFQNQCGFSFLRKAHVTQQLSCNHKHGKVSTRPNILRRSPVTTPQAQDRVAQLERGIYCEPVDSSERLLWKAFLLFGVRGGHEVNVEKGKKAED
ncbi:hypothetical protein K443DRAFT_337380 [Laccaria amethystina LaAM-08-1]|uniref:Uncharacterized protein n=1 Tax=Laccaria amethystina LaAM-08-1 TaxID=1095629 RepID=A0A0C9XGC3_9AGAR|nr:hypothetical protein K443DRAFT_337380 [Laccaria amethystina LaAM-08-1]